MSFARKVRFTVKHGKSDEFRRLMTSEVHPMLKLQKGFRDNVTLLHADAGHSISIWDDRTSAESYGTKVYPEVLKKLGSVVEGAPSVEMFESVFSSSGGAAVCVAPAVETAK